MMKNLNVAFVGAGNMASSLIGGLIKKGLNPDNIYISDPSPAQCQQLVDTYGVKACADNSEACLNADVLLLAVKPQVMGAVLADIKSAMDSKQPLLISIAAGIPLAFFQKMLGEACAVVRCMPNTPALVGLGATGLVANDMVSAEQKMAAQQILEAVGIAMWLKDERQIDAVTALSGSGPAYFFLVMEAMIAAGQSLGLDEEMAKALTLQTALGAATMAQQSEVSPAELRVRVTSPGGTTEQALNRFEEGGLKALFATAINSAEARSQELAKLTQSS